LLKFDRTQTIFKIGSLMVGGQPGELPTVLVGSIFYEGHKLVKDKVKGVFDKKKAEELIVTQDALSDKTGVPCMVDVVGQTVESLVRYIDFVSEVTDKPLLINGPNFSVRVEATKHAVEVGLAERAVYNSVNYTLRDEEINAISETGVKAAIIQAFNPRDVSLEGIVKILTGSEGKRGLLEMISNAGVDKPLILTPVLDVPGIGPGVRGIYEVKESLGLPTGTAPVGVVGRWKKVDELGKYAKKICRAGAVSLAQSFGANFIIYGSLAKARNIFPVCAMNDAIIAYAARNFGIKPLTRNHPLYKIF